MRVETGEQSLKLLLLNLVGPPQLLLGLDQLVHLTLRVGVQQAAHLDLLQQLALAFSKSHEIFRVPSTILFVLQRSTFEYNATDDRQHGAGSGKIYAGIVAFPFSYFLPSFPLLSFFTSESNYCFQRVIAIAILSVCPSVCHRGGSVKNGAS